MIEAIIPTQISVDAPTSAGNIYPRDELEAAVERFNKKLRHGPIIGGLLDRAHIQRLNNETHETLELIINESGMLCAKIRLLETDEGLALTDKINRLVARPIMVIPVKEAQEKDRSTSNFIMSEITSIARVQLEVQDEEY